MTVARFRDRLVIDEEKGELRDGAARYLMIRDDSLMGMFRALPEAARAEAFAALARSIVEYGSKSAASYQAMGAQARDELLAVITATSPQIGWGRWTILAADDDRLEIEVANSPFVTGYGASDKPVCAAIAGMVEALGGLVLGRGARAEEISCAATGKAKCVFRAVPR